MMAPKSLRSLEYINNFDFDVKNYASASGKLSVPLIKESLLLCGLLCAFQQLTEKSLS